MHRYLCVFAVLAPLECNSPLGVGGALDVSPSSDIIRVTGTVRYYDLEGGFWAVRGDDATTYDPVGGLPSDFQQDGLRVRLEARMTSLLGIHQVGPIVEIISLQRI